MRVLAALELVEQSKNEALGLDREMLWKIAEEIKVGSDKMFEENKTDVLKIYDITNNAMQRSFDA